MTELEAAIAGLTSESTERDVSAALSKLRDACLGPGEHERTADTIRRRARMARSTFRRLLKHSREPQHA